MSKPRVEVDSEAEAAYVYLHDGDIVRTVWLDHGIMLDLDADNKIIGLELLNYRADNS